MTDAIVDAPTEVTRYLDQVRQLADANRDALGFLPATAYEEAAMRGCLWGVNGLHGVRGCHHKHLPSGHTHGPYLIDVNSHAFAKLWYAISNSDISTRPRGRLLTAALWVVLVIATVGVWITAWNGSAIWR